VEGVSDGEEDSTGGEAEGSEGAEGSAVDTGAGGVELCGGSDSCGAGTEPGSAGDTRGGLGSDVDPGSPGHSAGWANGAENGHTDHAVEDDPIDALAKGVAEAATHCGTPRAAEVLTRRASVPCGPLCALAGRIWLALDADTVPVRTGVRGRRWRHLSRAVRATRRAPASGAPLRPQERMSWNSGKSFDRQPALGRGTRARDGTDASCTRIRSEEVAGGVTSGAMSKSFRVLT
jgi:hypothetical protein